MELSPAKLFIPAKQRSTVRSTSVGRSWRILDDVHHYIRLSLTIPENLMNEQLTEIDQSFSAL